MPKINVLQATLYLKMGGLETVIMDMCRHHDRNSLNVKVVCFNGYDPVYKQELESLGIEVILLSRSGRYDLSFFWRLTALFRQWNIDVLHAHSGCIFNTVLCAQLAGVPVKIVTEHGLPIYDDGQPMPVTFKTRIEDFIIRQLTDKFVAVSSEIEAGLLARYSTKVKKITTIINGIDVERFKMKASVKDFPDGWDIPADKKIIGSVGRLVLIKNYSCLLTAFAILYEKNKTLHLVLVGDGPERKKLENQVLELGISTAVSILGVRNDIAEILPRFDVFVLSSLTEGTSISLLEAQACGVPSVVTRVGGNPNVIMDGVNGFLVTVDAAADMADCIEKIVTDRNLSSSMSENARKRTVERYDIHNMVGSYVAMYSQLLCVKRPMKIIETSKV